MATDGVSNEKLTYQDYRPAQQQCRIVGHHLRETLKQIHIYLFLQADVRVSVGQSIYL